MGMPDVTNTSQFRGAARSVFARDSTVFAGFSSVGNIFKLLSYAFFSGDNCVGWQEARPESIAPKICRSMSAIIGMPAFPRSETTWRQLRAARDLLRFHPGVRACQLN